LNLLQDTIWDLLGLEQMLQKLKVLKNFIKVAKNCGMFVTANFMRSYALPSDKFTEKVVNSERYGADLVYLVDSAGGLLVV
jgi:4-hydroxy 2-oxovalerate aldolase